MEKYPLSESSPKQEPSFDEMVILAQALDEAVSKS